ncbi:hypothetical protein [Natronococcus sp.]|uniref:hypothetical protein n=1 Tax=Natronococcus sp. TaxID=35747 RepID=UPI003A4E2700
MTTRTRYALSIAAAALAGVAFAQGADVGALETPSGANPLLLLVIGGAVAYLRSTPLFAKIDGPATVPLFAMVVGGVVGAGGELIGAIETGATSVLGAPWSGAAAGILAAIEAVFGVSLFRYLGKVLRRDAATGKLEIDAKEAIVAAKEIAGAKPEGPVGTAVAFLLDTAERMLGQAPTGAALVALYPTIVKWAQAPELLTDDVRAKIQTDVLGALNRAGLIGQDLL